MNKLVASSELQQKIMPLSTAIEKLEQAMILLWEVRGMIRNDVESLDSYIHSANAAIQAMINRIEKIGSLDETLLKLQELSCLSLERYQGIDENAKAAYGAIEAMIMEMTHRKCDLARRLFNS